MEQPEQNLTRTGERPPGRLSSVATANRRSLFPLSLMASLVFFGSLWLLDFPKPAYDDLFLCGASLNLVEGGDLSNPLLERQQWPSHFYFIQPPLYSYAQAGWLKIFGISGAALTGFQAVMYLIIAGATIAIIRQHKGPVLVEYLVPFAVSAAWLSAGLRIEPLAVALTMLGFALLECGCMRNLAVFFAYLLMFLGASTAPRMTSFSMVLIFLAGQRSWRDFGVARRDRWVLCGLVLGAIMVASFLFLWMIDFRIREFWETFHYVAAQMSGGGKIKLLIKFMIVTGPMQWPLLLMPFVLLWFARHKPLHHLSRIGLFLVGAFAFMVAIGGLGYCSVWYTILALLLLAVPCLKNFSGRRKLALQVAVSLIFLVANRKHFVKVFGQLTGEIRLEQSKHFNEALALRPTPEHPVLLDGSVARYIFNYRIPPGCLDLEFAVPFPQSFIADAKLQENDIFLAGPQTLDLLNDSTYLAQSPTKWIPFGVAKLANYKYPREVYIIPAKMCQGLRSEAASR